MILCEKPGCYLVFYFKYQFGSADLYTSVAQEHLRSDALPDTTVFLQELNTGPIVRRSHALPIAPRPLPHTRNRHPFYCLLLTRKEEFALAMFHMNAMGNKSAKIFANGLKLIVMPYM